MIPADVAIANEAADRARVELMGIFKDLIPRNLGSGGESYGMVPMDRGERILQFEEDARSGALDILKVQSPDIYWDYVQEYISDVTAQDARTEVK